MKKLKICLIVLFLRVSSGVRNLRYRPLLALLFLPIIIGITVLWINRPKLIELDYLVNAFAIFLSGTALVWFLMKMATSFQAKSDKIKIQEGFWNANKQLNTNLLFVVWRQCEKNTNILTREVFSYNIDGETWRKCLPNVLWALDSVLEDDIEVVGNKCIRFRTIPNRKPKARPAPQDPLFKKDGGR